MRALAFVRYHSGDGAGHVGWAFELPDGRVSAGSVENHSGHLFTPARRMGFWNVVVRDPMPALREHGYDDMRIFDVAGGAADALRAYRVVLWIRDSAYQAVARNCEDDVYDVLRAYGVPHLEAPFFNWFPRWWFTRMHAPLYHVNGYAWPTSAPTGDPGVELAGAAPWRPTWRRPWHSDFHRLTARKLVRFPLPARNLGTQG